MKNTIPSKLELNEFLKKETQKTINYLSARFSLRREEIEDVVQDASIDLYNNIVTGKLQELTASLSTYFTQICHNKTLNYVRDKKKEIPSDDVEVMMPENPIDSTKVDDLIDTFGGEDDIEAQKEKLVHKVINKLPPKCSDILWGYYRDGHSMKTLADMFDFASSDVVKTTKSRCLSNFKKLFNNFKIELRYD